MAATETTDTRPRGKKTFAGSLSIIVLLALIGAALYLYSGMFSSSAGPKQENEKLAVMEVRLNNLENSSALYADRLAKLEKAEADNARAVASNHEASDHAAPAAAPAPVEAAPAVPLTGDEGKRIEGLEKELATLKQAAHMQDHDHLARSITLLSNYHRLTDKVLSGKPYSGELATLQDTLGDSENKQLSQLATYAESGIPTQAELMTSFDNAAAQVSSVQAVPPPEAGAWDRFTFNLAHLVRIRRIDQAQTGKDVDSIIGRASAHLDKNEIEAAVAEINALPDAARADFSGWLEDAQIAIDMPGIIDQLEEQVMQQVFETQSREAAPATTPPASPAASAPPASSGDSKPPAAAKAPFADKGLNIQ